MIEKKNPLAQHAEFLKLFKQMKFGAARRIIKQIMEKDAQLAKDFINRALDKYPEA